MSKSDGLMLTKKRLTNLTKSQLVEFSWVLLQKLDESNAEKKLIFERSLRFERFYEHLK